MKRIKLLLIILGATCLLTTPAAAHPIQGVGDFYAGMLHPVTSLETALALIGFALLAGQQQQRTALHLLIALPIAIAAGAGIAHLGIVLMHIPVLLLVLTAVFGFLVAISAQLPEGLLISLGALAGIAIGWTNAIEITRDTSFLRFAAGLTTVSLLITSYGIGLLRTGKAAWAKIAVRVVGSWIGAVGILVLGLK